MSDIESTMSRLGVYLLMGVTPRVPHASLGSEYKSHDMFVSFVVNRIFTHANACIAVGKAFNGFAIVG